MISAWPLESESNVIHEDLFYNFLNQLYSGEGILKAGDLAVTVDTDGIGVKVAAGAAIVLYDSAFGGKRVFFNSAENKSGPNKHPNSSFTVNTNRWAAVGAATLTRDTGTFLSTPASGKIATSGASTFNQGIKTPTTAAAGYRVNSSEQQEVSCWVNAPVGTTVRLKITEYNAAGTAGATQQKDVAGTGAWLKIIIDPWITASTCKFLGTEILISAAGSVNVFVDDFEVRQNFDWIQAFEISDPTNPRVDRLVVQIRDSMVTGGGDTVQDAKFRVISGTPTSGATLVNLTGAAAVPSNCFLIANVLVPANATALVGGNLDQTVMLTAGLNVPTAAPLAGFIHDYGGSAAPNASFLLCDGASYTTSAQPALFAVIGYTYGGSGANFNVPDIRGRTTVMKGTHTDVDALGENDGETVGNRRPKHKHTNSIASGGSHSHDFGGSTGSGGSHSHSEGVFGSGDGLQFGGDYSHGPGGGTTGSAGDHSHGFSGTTDSGGSHGHAGSTVGPTTNVPTDAPAFIVTNKLITTGL